MNSKFTFLKTLLIISLIGLTMMISKTSYAQMPDIKINGSVTIITDFSMFPYWLHQGQTLEPGNKVNYISVLEYNVVPALGGGYDLQFENVISVSALQTVPVGKTWKIESVSLDGTAGTIGVTGPVGPSGIDGIDGLDGATGPTGPTGPIGPTGQLVPGANGQTLRHDGNYWEASSTLYNSGTNIGVGTGTPDASAIIDISSTTKGALIPRLTTSEQNAIASPATGLIIYNTDCNTINFNAGTPSVPDWVTISSSNAVPASVIITATPAGAVCQGSSVTYSAIITNGGTSPTYQWYKNSIAITNETGITFINTTPTNGDIIHCVITSNAPCVTGSPATSNSIAEIVNPTLFATVNISVTPSGAVCPGDNVSFTATPANGGSNPSYQWKKNGADISGATSATYASTSLANGDEITCVMTSNLNCVTGSPATSNVITLTVNTVNAASVAISANPSGITCPGDNILFTATPTHGGASPTYQWKLNGSNISGATGTTYSSNALANGDEISCVMTSNLPCVTGSPATSNTLTISIGGSTGSQTFNYTGASQTFTVPACVTQVNIEVWGAQGGTGNGASYSNNPGGLGGYSTGTKTVTPGSTLYVNVGGAGGNGIPSTTGGAGGWNGGGSGTYQSGHAGGGGGGASDVRLGGTALTNRIIVGGGGGGAGTWQNANGGAGGYPTGETGYNNVGGGPGTGGTQTAGGTGPSGQGALGVGGSDTGSDCGAGGGGGYYGGGASDGCNSSGAGGGSSYSGGMTGNTSHSNGAKSGNGQIIISW